MGWVKRMFGIIQQYNTYLKLDSQTNGINATHTHHRSCYILNNTIDEIHVWANWNIRLQSTIIKNHSNIYNYDCPHPKYLVVKCDVGCDMLACEVGVLPRWLYHTLNHRSCPPTAEQQWLLPLCFPYDCRLSPPHHDEWSSLPSWWLLKFFWCLLWNGMP